MNITDQIKNYQNTYRRSVQEPSIFLDLVNEILTNFPYKLTEKTYLLVPDQKQELLEISYEYSITTGKLMPLPMTIRMNQLINKFNEAASKLGFTVISSINEYKNDGQIIDLLGSESVNKGQIEEERTDFKNVNIPLTLTVDEYIKKPFVPVVFKNITANRGEDKYLIETREQFNKILAVLNLPESENLGLKNEFVVQEYINSYDDISSSMRVLCTSSGDILSSLFLYSTDTKPKKRIKTFGFDVFNPCEYLNDPNSPYYLNTRNIISNAAGGGKVVPLNKDLNNLSAEDEIFLSLHDIDVETLELPKSIADQCQEVCACFGSEKGIVLGVDFIYNADEEKWYYLETNRNPSVEGYRRFMGLTGYEKKDIKTLMHLHSLTKIVEKTVNKEKQEDRIRKM